MTGNVTEAVLRDLRALDLGGLSTSFTPAETLDALKALYEQHLRSACILYTLINGTEVDPMAKFKAEVGQCKRCKGYHNGPCPDPR